MKFGSEQLENRKWRNEKEKFKVYGFSSFLQSSDTIFSFASIIPLQIKINLTSQNIVTNQHQNK
jgi:hypothetical protein